MASIDDLKRMCKTMSTCIDCPLHTGGISCMPITLPNNIDEIVDKWVTEHPVKTYAMDFFEKFPNALRGRNGDPQICRNYVYGDGNFCFSKNCAECWNQEMEKR